MNHDEVSVTRYERTERFTSMPRIETRTLNTLSSLLYKLGTDG